MCACINKYINISEDNKLEKRFSHSEPKNIVFVRIVCVICMFNKNKITRSCQ